MYELNANDEDFAVLLKDGVDLTELLLKVDPSSKLKVPKPTKLEFKQIEAVGAFIQGKIDFIFSKKKKKQKTKFEKNVFFFFFSNWFSKEIEINV
jgi:hypothetical protein